MSRSVQKDKCNLDAESEDEDGYVKIRYQQLHLPALEIPIKRNGDLPWKLVQALDSKIIGLAIQSKEKRRIIKIKNGVIKEPKEGWKTFKVIALLEEPDESIAKDAIRSTAVSKSEVKTEEENISVKDSVHSVDVSVPNPTTVLPELACLTKPVDSNIEHSIPENVHDSLITTEDSTSHCDVSGVLKNTVQLEKGNVPATDFAYSTNMSIPSLTTSLLPELACLVNDASNKKNSFLKNSSSVQSVVDDDVIMVLEVPLGFSTNTHSSQTLFDEYKDAFIQRMSQQNLKIPIKDPLFLDRLLFLRKNLKFYFVPKYLKPNPGDCLPCEEHLRTFQEFICHIFSIIHIKNALTQKDLDWFCTMLHYIQNDEKNGYRIKLPLFKRKADIDERTGDAVPKKRSKNI